MRQSNSIPSKMPSFIAAALVLAFLVTVGIGECRADDAADAKLIVGIGRAPSGGGRTEFSDNGTLWLSALVGNDASDGKIKDGKLLTRERGKDNWEKREYKIETKD